MAFAKTCYPVRTIKVRKLSVARIRDIEMASYQEVVNRLGNWQFNILFDTGDWIKIPVLPGATLKLSHDNTRQGALYTHITSADIPTSDTDAVHDLVNLAEEDLLVLVEDISGAKHLSGTIEQCCSLTFDTSIGGASESAIRLSTKGRHPVYGFAPVVNV